MIFCKNLDADVPILELYDQIGITNDDYGVQCGISGQEFADYVKFIEGQGKKGIDIYINSVGGSIIEGMTIIAAIRSCKLPVNTICVGVAISMAGVILQVGKVRKMVKEGIMMIHPPQGDEEKVLKTFKAALLQYLYPRTDMTEEEMEDLMMRETWLTAQECLELKLIDEIVDITSIANAPEVKKIENRASKLKKIVNELKTKPEPQKTNPMDLTKIKNVLNLNGDATETQVADTLKDLVNSEKKAKKAVEQALKTARTIQNKKDEDDDDGEDSVSALKKEMDNLKKASKKLDEDMADVKSKLDAKNLECENLKNENEDLKNVGNKVEAEAVVDKAIEEGKIKADKKAKFVNLYLADKEETLDILNGIVVNKAGAKMAIQNTNLPKQKVKVEGKNVASEVAEGKDTNFIAAFRRKAVVALDNRLKGTK